MYRPTRHSMALLFALALLPSASRAAWRAEGTPLVSGRDGLYRDQLVSDGDGGAWLLFAGFLVPGQVLGLQHVGRDGPRPGWPAGGLVLESRSAGWSALASDGAGGVFVSWRRSTPGHSYAIVQHVLADGAFAPLWPDTGAVALDGSIGPATLSLAPDGAGGCFVAWQDFRNGYTNLQDPYLQHLGADGAPAPGWPASGLPLSGAAQDQYDPVLASDGAGGVYAAWWDYRDTTVTNFDIYAQRVNGDGSRPAGWPADGVAICTAAGGQFTPAITGDGAGGAIIAWEDSRTGAAGAYAQRVLASGALAAGWPVDGLRLGDPPPMSNPPALLPDDAGGAFAAWLDARLLADGQPGGQITRMTHVGANGAIVPGWPAEGAALFTDEPVPGLASLAPDGEGGALAAISVGFHARVRIVRLTAGGAAAPGWPAGGVTIEPSSGHDPGAVATDGAGGAFLAWIDDATGVVGQRVGAGGVIAPGWDGFPDALWMANPAPSPTRGAATFRFALPEAAPVTLRVYGVTGTLVREVVRDLALGAGQHALAWDGLDAHGRRARAGLYFSKLEAGPRRATRRLIVAP